jgi:uracil phosphoribosyltransferase
MGKVMIFDHPLIQHKVSLMRDKNTASKEFRDLAREVAMLMTYEITRDLPTKEVEIETPICPAKVPILAGKKLAIVPILRAGLGFVDGMLEIIPSARVGHVGLYRDPETHEPVEYYCKLPDDIETKDVYLIDPMLATGGSAIDAVKILKKHGAKQITFICIIAAPEGVKAFCELFPDIPLYIGALDRCLNSDAYICPGLGDCGDRVFGTIGRK